MVLSVDRYTPVVEAAAVAPAFAILKLNTSPLLTIAPNVRLLTVRSGNEGGGEAGAKFQPIASSVVKSAAEIGAATPGEPKASKASGVELDAQSPRSPPDGATL